MRPIFIPRDVPKGPGHSFGFRISDFGFFPLLLCLLWISAAVAWGAGSITARVDRETVPVGETFTLSLIFEGVQPSGTPTLPALPNLSLVSTGESSEFSIGGGQTVSRKTINFTLAPTQAGEIAIPALQIQISGRVFTTQPLKVRAVPAGAAGANPQAALTNLAFLRLVTPKEEVYLGEAFPVELQLYWQNAENVQMPQLPAEGFSLGQASRPAQSTTLINGMQYNVAVFKMSATPAKPGLLTLGPAECNLTVLVPLQNARRRDPFDPFGFFGPRVQGRPTVLRSEPHPIRVLPLPTNNVPPSFSGAVGSYKLAVNAGPTNLAVGDPITVKVQISGQGPLESLALPDQPNWRDFKTYPPTSKVEPLDALGLAGAKTFEQVVIPQNHEITALPGFQFSFFDPNARAYRTLSSAPVPLTVRPTLAVALPALVTTNAGTSAPPPQVDDIVHIRARLEPLGIARPPLVYQPWFLGLQAVPLLAWLALWAARRRAEALANNPRLRRRREVDRRVQEGLREMRVCAGQQKSDEFFAALFHLLQEQLGERLDLPASAITEAVIDERLRERELPAETLAELRELFQACNQARYAPLKTSHELASFIPRLEAVLRRLREMNVP